MTNKIVTDFDLIQNNRISNTLDELSVQIRLLEHHNGPKDYLIQLKRELERIRLIIKLTRTLPHRVKIGQIDMEWD
jgi:hypothetical protein